jgi:hypothetical protein
MALPHIPEIPIIILFPIGIIVAIVLIIFVVRVLAAEIKKPWYRSPTFMIPLAALILLVSFFTFKIVGLVILLVAVVVLTGGALVKRLRR